MAKAPRAPLMRAPVLSDLKNDYPLHQLGWKSFQDLCIAVAEEILKRPVQRFLPTNDAGRDGAFIGTWKRAGANSGTSTIQCKFTSRIGANLTLSLLNDELVKARRLAAQGLATDYIILTNHPISGQAEAKIKLAFEKTGVKTCRIFGHEWIVSQIRESPRLRMMAPRLYGLGDLTELIDSRAYAQARLILSEMGDNLKKLVVTEAHRQSVRAISKHSIVLLLGSPAAGKSTIGGSLAIGAADIWDSHTIKATSPDDVQKHIDPNQRQFFWVDDAWGSTQYQRDRTEAWNQVFPLMQGAIRQGSKFLLTSRDYIWNSAKNELKLQALPILKTSQVVINVHEFSIQEKAQILYNHLKLGDQRSQFKRSTKPSLPRLAALPEFLPESARRLGSTFFTTNVWPTESRLVDFFERPEEFLQDTITNLSKQCRAAIALIFLNGGKVRSPIPAETIEPIASRWDTTVGSIRDELASLNGSILLLAQDDDGPYWTYKHPTMGDAFAKHVARHPELIEIYLRGAKPASIVQEVVCAGSNVQGAQVVVPTSLYDLLKDRIGSLSNGALASFLSYRSSRRFSELMLKHRPDIFDRFAPGSFIRPLKDDMDAVLLARLHDQGLLPKKIRKKFVEEVREAALDEVDSSMVDDQLIGSILTPKERSEILNEVSDKILGRIDAHFSRVRQSWDDTDQPDHHFDSLCDSLKSFAKALSSSVDTATISASVDRAAATNIEEMQFEYQPIELPSAPTQESKTEESPLDDLFRDVDD